MGSIARPTTLKPALDDQGHSSRPNYHNDEVVSKYASRALPPTPPESRRKASQVSQASRSSSVYSTDTVPEQPAVKTEEEDEIIDGDFAGSLDEDAVAMIRPSPTSLMSQSGQHHQQQQGQLHGASQEASPPPLTMAIPAEVSPVLTPPTGRMTYKLHQVSPLTPEESDEQWRDIPATQPQLQPPMSSAAPPQHSQFPSSRDPTFRHSDPGSPTQQQDDSRILSSPLDYYASPQYFAGNSTVASVLPFRESEQRRSSLPKGVHFAGSVVPGYHNRPRAGSSKGGRGVVPPPPIAVRNDGRSVRDRTATPMPKGVPRQDCVEGEGEGDGNARRENGKLEQVKEGDDEGLGNSHGDGHGGGGKDGDRERKRSSRLLGIMERGKKILHAGGGLRAPSPMMLGRRSRSANKAREESPETARQRIEAETGVRAL